MKRLSWGTPVVLMMGLVLACAPASPPEASAPLGSVVAPSASQSLAAKAGWEQSNNSVYHLWVASFRDSSGDGVGDLGGITAAVDEGYFDALGVKTLWLSPVFQAASLTVGSTNKHGYDTTNYDQVAPLFGTNDDLAHLLVQAHARGLRVLFDFVPNHTSNQHPWFQKDHRDWYVWKDARPAGWNGFDGSSDWYGSGPYYYAVFGSSMPDLDYRNPAVVAEMRRVVTQWLNFGFDGLRVDAVKYLVEGSTPSQFRDQAETHTFFADLRSQVVDAYAERGYAKFMMDEDWDQDLANVRSYLNNGRAQFQVGLDFIWPYLLRDALTPPLAANAASRLAGHLVTDLSSLPDGTTLGMFQSNHDNVVDRPATQFPGDTDRQRLAAALTLLAPGLPLVYYGNEVGMTGASGTDTNLRTRFPWSAAQAQQGQQDSLWTWHAQLLRLRTTLAAWDHPRATLISADPGVLAWQVEGLNGSRAVVVANLSGAWATSALGVTGDLASVHTVLGTNDLDLSGGQLVVAHLPPLALRVLAFEGQAVTSTDGPLYLRGTFTTTPWDASVLLVDQGGGELAASFVASASSTTFKFGSATWSTAWAATQLTYDASVVGALPASAVAGSGAPDDNLVVATSAGTTYAVHLIPAQRRWWVLTTP